MGHGLYNKSVIVQRSLQIVGNLVITRGFDMTSAYEDFLSFYAKELDFDLYGHVFQSAIEHKGIGVRPALVNLVSNHQ